MIAPATAERIDPDSAEASFFVSDKAKGHVVATLLLEHLASRRRGQRIRRFVAELQGDNHAMLRVLKDAGFDIVRHSKSGVVHLEMSTTARRRSAPTTGTLTSVAAGVVSAR